ncbi:hypothetical protein SEMRO_1279_G258880.1 [Seminavis robusta]|uniref:Uncharacterized protein n=1 Tax=Seminavis robusta TaxID=568900 RepID=A0A9N8HTI8_9STRA|nr:hypothetical protein SEMRO_1279_G258880.1 [Seminavis robusta]|eukprot:Sro1279_g258880.1 n/a (550) ;mRNA; f:26239-27888
MARIKKATPPYRFGLKPMRLVARFDVALADSQIPSSWHSLQFWQVEEEKEERNKMSNVEEDNTENGRSYTDIPYAELGAVHPDAVVVGPTERYYKCSGEKAADLMAMGIGLKTFDLREIGNVEEEPYCSMKLKKKVTPTQKHMCDEIKRRCIVDGHLEPKCGHWDKKKCHSWLQKNPLTNASDRAFVVAAEKMLHDLVTKAANEKAKEKKDKGPAPWNTAEPYIRLIECMLDDTIRPIFLEMHRMGERDELDARNSADRPETIFEACARLFNDKNKKVFSRCLPDLHFTFAEALDCSFEHMPGPVTADEVKRRWGDSRAKLIKIIAKWELSGNGFGQRGVEEDEFGHLGDDQLQCGDNRANFLDSQTKEHILYLWHVADEAQILKNVMSVISDSCAASSEACSSVAGSEVAVTARNRRVDERALGFFRAKMGLAMHTMSRAAIFKELRETQDKLFESQVKVMETTSSNMSELYMGRVRMLEAHVKAVQECLDSLDGEEAEKKDRRERRANKRRKTNSSAAAAALDSDDSDSDDDDEDGDEVASRGSKGY